MNGGYGYSQAESSSTASSPFSGSTGVSSPEAAGNVSDHSSKRTGAKGRMGSTNGLGSTFTQPFSVPQPLQPIQSTKSPASGSTSARASVGAASSRASIATSQTSEKQRPLDRLMQVDGLPVVKFGLEDLAPHPQMNTLLLQGDPQVIQKQRVETAIRAIIDILRFVPSTSTPLHPSLVPLIPRDDNGQPAASLARIGTFRAIRLQAGTTTKTGSKKLQQAAPTPQEELLYMETAVFTTGASPRRVYPCKRCRTRELKRRQEKQDRRKRVPLGSEAADSEPRASLLPPSADYITGANPDQYDPLRHEQQVEEPPWDPGHADWRNEMVLFNSPPEVAVKDGSVYWLPFRVVCYGKCHGERPGFKIRFRLRDFKDRVITEATIGPIRITDDHKTEAKKTQPAVPRSRKSRASAASSRVTSPAPSESESVQSVSDIGAVVQKQSLQVRVKPYERPGRPSMTPMMPPGSVQPNLLDFVSLPPSIPAMVSPTTVPGMRPDSAFQAVPPAQMLDPTMDLYNNPAFSYDHRSTASSSAASPVVPMASLDGAFSPNALMSAMQSLQQPIMPDPNQQLHYDLAAMTSDFNAFNTSQSSRASQASMTEDSSYSGFPESTFSDSGVVPDMEMEGFVDYSGGEEHDLQPPIFGNPTSPTTQDHINQLLASLPPMPSISTVIPNEGPQSGGSMVAIIGENFGNETKVLFGDRMALVEKVTPTYMQVRAPPGKMPGDVDVLVQDYPAPLVPAKYKYLVNDTELMRLALQVREQYQGSSNNAAFQLAQHVARHSNPGSDRSLSSSSASPQDAASGPPSGSTDATEAKTAQNLQSTLLDLMSSLDVDSPGSLRRSGAVNLVNPSKQSMLHLASALGFHQLLELLIDYGAHLELKDLNGFTALAHAAFAGQTKSVRVLLAAGAAYDRPTILGENALDLAKAAEHREVEEVLLSAVWSTDPEALAEAVDSALATSSHIDEDNPSSGSDAESHVSQLVRRRSRRRGKSRASPPSVSSTLESEVTPQPTLAPSVAPSEAPPPYSAPSESWINRTLPLDLPTQLSSLAESWGLPVSSLFDKDPKSAAQWIALPAPSWETIQKMASPEEVKLFTQAMAAAAFNAVIQVQGQRGTDRSRGAHASTNTEETRMRKRKKEKGRASRRGSSGSGGSPSKNGPAVAVVQHVKQDRMLYLFWLPILLFVGFWLMVTAVPIATGFCLIYARQMFRAVKQRM